MDALGHDRALTMTHAGSCPQCFQVFPPIAEAAPKYFESGRITCSKCHTQSDLWSVALARMLAGIPTPMSIVPLGAVDTHFLHQIEADKYHEIDLTTIGIPADATVLQVGYTPQGGEDGVVFPIETHGNVPPRKIVGNVLRLLGRPFVSGDGTVGTACPVAIWVVWVPQQKEEGWQYILGAFEALVYGQYDRVIVPAQSAVEITVMPVISELLERHASAVNVKRFMVDGLTFGNVINIVLPFLCAQAGVPRLPEKIRISLNKLRKLRNRLVHSGIGGESISAQEAAEGLCAAVFGFEYVRYAKPKLQSRLK